MTLHYFGQRRSGYKWARQIAVIEQGAEDWFPRIDEGKPETMAELCVRTDKDSEV